MKLKTTKCPEAELLGLETGVDAKDVVEVMNRAKLLTKDCEELLKRGLI